MRAWSLICVGWSSAASLLPGSTTNCQGSPRRAELPLAKWSFQLQLRGIRGKGDLDQNVWACWGVFCFSLLEYVMVEMWLKRSNKITSFLLCHWVHHFETETFKRQQRASSLTFGSRFISSAGTVVKMSPAEWVVWLMTGWSEMIHSREWQASPARYDHTQHMMVMMMMMMIKWWCPWCSERASR